MDDIAVAVFLVGMLALIVYSILKEHRESARRPAETLFYLYSRVHGLLTLAICLILIVGFIASLTLDWHIGASILLVVLFVATLAGNVWIERGVDQVDRRAYRRRAGICCPNCDEDVRKHRGMQCPTCGTDLPQLCAVCGYDIRNLKGRRCPECGWSLPRRRRMGTPPAPDKLGDRSDGPSRRASARRGSLEATDGDGQAQDDGEHADR